MFGYALLGLANFTVLRHAVAAPRVLRGVTYVLCFFGATILPGMVLIDFYDLALATEMPPAQGVAVAEAAGSYGLAAIAQAPAMVVISSVVILTAYAIIARGILHRPAPAPRAVAVPVAA